MATERKKELKEYKTLPKVIYGNEKRLFGGAGLMLLLP